MNRSRCGWNKKEVRASRTTRSSGSQVRHTDPSQTLQPGPGLYGEPQLQDLSQMSAGVAGVLPTSETTMSTGSRDPVQTSLPSQASPPVFGAKPSPRGGLASVARLVKLGRCKNIVVVAGAGISTASGIPDFRTPGTGLYANLEKYSIPYPEAIFNIDYFSNDPQPFFSLAKALYPGTHRPNYIHYFIRTLHLKGLLLRTYTQNIDGLEKLCGLPEDKLVEAHGSFATASCHLCYTTYPADEAKHAIMNDKVPVCSFCAATVKPDVVFFGEDLPEKYFLHTEDFPKADLLIIMGTSLQIEPCASLVNTVRAAVPRLLLNRHAVGPFQKTPLRRGDYVELGDLEVTVRRFAELLGWSGDIEELMRTQETLIIPALISSPPSASGPTPCESREAAMPLAEQEIRCRSESGAVRPSSSCGEETDSESDSKSSASSVLSN